MRFSVAKTVWLSAFIFLAIPFGGRILKVIPAAPPCSIIIIVGPPSPGIFTITGSTRIYAHRSIKEKSWVLGIASPLSNPLCPPAIIMMGTSKF